MSVIDYGELLIWGQKLLAWALNDFGVTALYISGQRTKLLMGHRFTNDLTIKFHFRQWLEHHPLESAICKKAVFVIFSMRMWLWFFSSGIFGYLRRLLAEAEAHKWLFYLCSFLKKTKHTNVWSQTSLLRWRSVWFKRNVGCLGWHWGLSSHKDCRFSGTWQNFLLVLMLFLI